MDPVSGATVQDPESAPTTCGPSWQADARTAKVGRWLLLLGAIVLVCIIIARDIGTGEFDYNVDEAQHAVTGLFVADALHDLPLRHPVQYAYR